VESLSLVEVQGDSAFAKSACKVIPRLHFTAPPGSRERSMLVVPFTYFPGPSMPVDFLALPESSRTRLENMSTVERRDYLLGKGCRRFR
jgi:hypothetical protein